MSEGFDRSDVSIYPVRTVMLGSPDNVDGASRSGMDSIDTLDQFAQMTGGRPDAGKDRRFGTAGHQRHTHQLRDRILPAAGKLG
jgi:hypothetical protein